MGKQHLVYERYICFNAEIHKGRFPNASMLANQFKISRRTAHRNIAFIRDMLGAPLVYDQKRGGYKHHRPFTLPDLPVSPEELLSILIARNLPENTESGFIGQAIRHFGPPLISRTEDIGLSERHIRHCFSAVWHSYYPSDSGAFYKVTQTSNSLFLLPFTATKAAHRAERETSSSPALYGKLGTSRMVSRTAGPGCNTNPGGKLEPCKPSCNMGRQR